MRAIALAVLLIPGPAAAYTLRYKVKEAPPADELSQKLWAATGLYFGGFKCLLSDGTTPCNRHGHLISGAGTVVVEVYQTKAKEIPLSKPVTVTAELKKKIGRVVLGLP